LHCVWNSLWERLWAYVALDRTVWNSLWKCLWAYVGQPTEWTKGERAHSTGVVTARQIRENGTVIDNVSLGVALLVSRDKRQRDFIVLQFLRRFYWETRPM
jgi:hypothetical protein